MCNRYRPPNTDDIRARWLTEPKSDFPPGPWSEVFPRKPGLFLRPGSSDELELVQARWQLVPAFHRKPLEQFKLSTNNARWEDKVRTSPTFKPSWLGGRRCIIPALWFNEPNWETGTHEPWKFATADGRPFGLAGLWNRWHGPAGEVVETYTMITINADSHELMNRMHKPDPKFGPTEQDKRMVVVIDQADEAAWLRGTPDEAAAVVRQWPVEKFSAGPLVGVAESKPVALDPTTGELF
jgi:putative SOS response-associated peptidase YedK